MKLILTISAIAASLLWATSCYNDNEEELYPKTPVTCVTENVAFGAFVSPLINQSCAFSGCHSAASRANGINLGDYTTIKSYITSQKARFLGSIKHQSGFDPMPKGGTKLSDCNIAKIEAWINAGMPNN